MTPQNGNTSPQGNSNSDKQGGLSWSAPAQKPAAPVVPQKAPAPEKAAAPAAPEKKSGAPSRATPATMNSTSAAKIAGWLAAGIVAGVVIAWGVTLGVKHQSSVATTDGQNVTSTSTTTQSQIGQGSDSSLTVMSPQKAGSVVQIDKAIVSEPTWIVVYESRMGKPGNVLGAALFFPDHEQGSVTLLRATTAGQTYFVTKQADNGDHKFSLTEDPLLTENGQAMWVSFSAN